MDPLFAKLNLKDEREVLVLGAPESFGPVLAGLKDVTVRTRVSTSRPVEFALVFCTTQRQVDSAAAAIVPLATADAKLWFVYPKQTSKRYRCEFNRDTGWAALGAAGFEGVRMVAVDEDWSALRFRRVTAIKSLKRAPSRALSTAGRARAVAAKKK